MTEDISNKAKAAALAIIVILNWAIAHLATSWAMPPEVQSAAQTLLDLWLGWSFLKMKRRAEARSPLPTGGGPGGATASAASSAR